MSSALAALVALFAASAEPREPREPPPRLVSSPAEAAALAILERLAALAEAEQLAGITAARTHGSALYDGPLTYLAERGASVILRERATTALADLVWPDDAAALEQRVAFFGRQLDWPEAGVRRAAIAALGEYPLPSAAASLAAHRHRAEASERELVLAAQASQRAAPALRRLTRWLGRGVAAQGSSTWQLANAGAQLLRDPQGEQAAPALALLLRAADQGSARNLVRFAARSGSPAVRLAALAHMREQPSEGDVPTLLHLLEHLSSPTRAAAIACLASHPSRAVGSQLVALLHRESDDHVRTAIGAALRALPPNILSELVVPTLRGPAGPARDLVVALVRDLRDPSLIWPKTLALAAAHSREGVEALLAEPAEARRDVLARRMLEPSLTPTERLAAVTGLDGAVDATLAAPLLALVDEQSDPLLCGAVARLLADVDDAALVAKLRELRPRLDRERRATVAALLAERTSPEREAALVDALREERDPGLAAELIPMLPVTGNAEARAAVAERLRLAEERPVLTTALTALHDVDDPALAQPLGALVAALGTSAPSEHSADAAGLAWRAYDELVRLPAAAAGDELRRLVVMEELAPALRSRAVTDLGRFGSPDDAVYLEPLRKHADRELRAAVRRALHDLDPAQHAEFDGWGRLPLVAASAGFGATLLSLTTEIADAEQRKSLLTIGGGVLGGSTAYLLTLDSDVSVGEAGYLATLGLWGTLAGHGMGNIAGLPGSGPLWSAIAGELAGVATGWATLRSSRFGISDVGLTNFAALSWGVGALSIAHLAGAEGGQAGPGDVFALGGAAAVLPLAVLSPRLRMDGHTYASLAFTMGWASWLGGFAPLALMEDAGASHVLAGLGAGQAVGLAAGLAAGNLTRFDNRALAWLSLGALSGAGAGAGIGMVSERVDARGTYGLLELGTLAAGGTLAWLGPKLRLRATDRSLIAMTTIGGAISGARWVARTAELAEVPGVSDEASGSELWGGGLLGGAIGLYAGLATSQFVDLTPGELALTTVAAGTTGLAAASFSLLSSGLTVDEHFSPLFSAGAAAGGLTVAFMAPHLRYTAADASLALSAAAVGGVLGNGIPAYWTKEERPLADAQQAGGTMLGASLGVLYAGVVSQLTEVDPHHVLRIDMATLGGMAFGAGLGLLDPRLDRRSTVALMQIGGLGAFTVATFKERHRTYSHLDRMRLVLPAALGAWAGGYAPLLYGLEGPVRDEERVGGAMVGAGLGLLAGRFAVASRPSDEADLGETLVTSALGATLGAGAWKLRAGSRRARAVALEAATAIGYAAGELLSPYTEYTGATASFVALAAAEGAIAGRGLPMLLELDGTSLDDQRVGGAMLGAGLLGTVAMAHAAVRPLDGDDVFEIGVGSALGTAAGFGLARSARDGDTRSRLLGAELGWAASLAASWALSPYTSYSAGDIAWIASFGAIGAWSGGWAPSLARGRAASPASITGGLTAGSALGLLGGMALTQTFEAPAGHAGEATSVAAAAAAISAGLAALEVPARRRDQALVAEFAVGAGLGAGALLAPLTPPLDSSTLLAFGLLGGWHGVLLAPWLGREGGQHYAGGAMVGTGAGLLVGYALDPFTDFAAGELAEMLAGAALGSTFMGGIVKMRDTNRAHAALGLELASAAGAGLGLVIAPYTHYDAADVPLLEAGLLWGAWQGLIAGAAFGDGAATSGARSGGGALVGASLGLGLAALGAQSLELSLEDVVEGSVWLGAGNLLGAGVGDLVGAKRRHKYALVQAGGVAGIAAGLLFAPGSSYRDADNHLIGLSVLLGLAHGAMLPRLWQPGDDVSDEETRGGTFVGAGLGLTAGMLLAEHVQMEGADILEAGLTILAGEAIALGVTEWIDLEDERAALALHAGGLGFAGLGMWAAQHTHYDQAARLLVVFGGAHGALLGGLAPNHWQDSADDRDYGAGALLGLAAGAVAGGALAQLTAFTPDDVNEIMACSILSSSLGGGLGLVLSDGDALWTGMMQATGIAGSAVAAALAPDTELSARDAGIGALAGLYGLYQGAGLSLLANGSERQMLGAMLATSAAGSLAGAYFGRALHLDATDMLMLAAGSAWGLWLGGWTAAVLAEETGSAEGERSVLELGVGTTAIATDAALVATSIAISRLVRMSPQRFAWISVGGGMGLVGGTAVAATIEGFSLRRGVLFGSLAGLTAATVITGFLDFAPRAESTPEATAGTPSTGVLPQLEAWFPSVGPAPSRDPARAADAGGMMLTVTALYR